MSLIFYLLKLFKLSNRPCSLANKIFLLLVKFLHCKKSYSLWYMIEKKSLESIKMSLYVIMVQFKTESLCNKANTNVNALKQREKEFLTTSFETFSLL